MSGVSEKAGKRPAAPRRRTGPVQPSAAALPEPFAGWFARRGWKPRDHQLALIAKSRARRSTLLVAPTGAGKTLAGFLPSLISLTEAPRPVRSEVRDVPAALEALLLRLLAKEPGKRGGRARSRTS